MGELPRASQCRSQGPTHQGAPGSVAPAGAEGRGVGVGLESPSRGVTCPKTKKRDGSRLGEVGHGAGSGEATRGAPGAPGTWRVEARLWFCPEGGGFEGGCRAMSGTGQSVFP